MVFQPMTSQQCLVVWVASTTHMGSIGCSTHISFSDHYSLSSVILMVRAFPNLSVSIKVLLKHNVNWNTICGAIHDLP